MNFSEKESKILMTAVYLQFFLLMIQLIIYEYLGTGSNGIVHMGILIMCAIPMVVSFFIWIKKNFMNAVAIYILAAFIFASQAFIYPENIKSFFVFGLYTLCMCLPCFINITMVDEKEHIKYLRKFSFFILMAGMIYFVQLELSNAEYKYNMAYSYYMLLPALVFTYLFFEKRRKRYAIASVICVSLIVLLGSRGAVVCWGVYVIFLLCFAKKYKILKFTVLIFLMLVFIFKETLLVALEKIIEYMNIESRSLYLILSGKFISGTSGRDEIWRGVVDLIKEEPITGMGIGADFTILGGYTHNFILDILLHFGVAFGGTILLGLVVMMIIAFNKARNKELYGLFMCYGFLPLMMSSTYLTWVPFWIFLGYCVSCLDAKLIWNDKVSFEFETVNQSDEIGVKKVLVKR